jgi:hypothetical protein
MKGEKMNERNKPIILLGEKLNKCCMVVPYLLIEEEKGISPSHSYGK